MADKEKRPELKGAFEEVLKILRETPELDPEFQNMELEEVIQRLEDALGTLSTEMDRVYKETGMTREQIEEYSKNPDNFSKEEWKLLTEVRDELENFEHEAEDVLGPAPMEVPAGEHEVVEKKPKKKKTTKKGWKRA